MAASFGREDQLVGRAAAATYAVPDGGRRGGRVDRREGRGGRLLRRAGQPVGRARDAGRGVAVRRRLARASAGPACVRRGLVRARPHPEVRAVADHVGLAEARRGGRAAGWSGPAYQSRQRVRARDQRGQRADAAPGRRPRRGPGSRAGRGRRSARRCRTGRRLRCCDVDEQLGGGARRQARCRRWPSWLAASGDGADDGDRGDGRRPTRAGGGR